MFMGLVTRVEVKCTVKCRIPGAKKGRSKRSKTGGLEGSAESDQKPGTVHRWSGG